MNRVLGGILLGIGILVAGLSGLCTILVIASSMPTMTEADIVDGLPIVLMIGGIPLLIGLAAIWGGRKLMRLDSGDDSVRQHAERDGPGPGPQGDNP